MRQRQPHRRTPRVFENPLFFSNHALVRLLVPLVIEQLLAVTIGMADTVITDSKSAPIPRMSQSHIK